MTVSKRGGMFAVECNECGEDIETQESDMNRALKMASDAGWRVLITPKNKLANACPACVETAKHRKD